MQKLTALAVLVLCAAVLSGTADAQLNIDVTVGYQMPTGDFSDSFIPGYGIGGDVFFGLPMIPLEVGGRAAFNRFGADDMFDDGSMQIIELLPSIRYTLGPPLSPVKIFGQLGAGMYNWSSEIEVGGFTTDDNGTDFGAAIGIGVKAKLGPMVGVTAMPMYHIIMTEDETTTYLALNVGVVF